ncbi:MAG: hypothetical protein IJS88_05505 [Alphaproteobacteria bacterium]|nr:hypothetical protein [Alphaproteobacteria bacterium]
MKNELILSALPHTWIFDVDGTICLHNGYKNGGDMILPGVKSLFSDIPSEDMIIVLTSRNISEKENLIKFMTDNGLRFNHIIFDVPMGERILINDNKPSGLKMAYAVDKKRDSELNILLKIDEEL